MKNIAIALMLAIALLTGAADPAIASPADPKHANERASCVGLIASDHARGIPDGTHISELIHGVRVYADATGSTPGEFMSLIAQEHLGSHAVCGRE